MQFTEYNDMDSGLIAGIGAAGMVFWLIVAVCTYAGMWKMFQKAGKPGWAAIVPIYNIIVLAEIVGKPIGFALMAALIPCVNIVLMVWLTNLLMKSFGKEVPLWTILAVLFPVVVFPVLGFGDARYVGPSAAEAQQNPFLRYDSNQNAPRDENQAT